MKTVTVNINLYSFNELSNKAQQRAIEDHRNFELSIMQPNDFISGDPEYDTEEELEKAYNSQYDYYLLNDEPIIENIEANDYLFFATGELANTTQYCGKHPKAGITEFKYLENVYTI